MLPSVGVRGGGTWSFGEPPGSRCVDLPVVEISVREMLTIRSYLLSCNNESGPGLGRDLPATEQIPITANESSSHAHSPVAGNTERRRR